MLQKLSNRKRGERGFTIIEVMIVLAIAGLILLIVFLAVPALQRNARSTQRKNDAAGALAALNEYENNNGGTFPTAAAVAPGTGTLTFTGAAGTATSTGKLGYYTAVTLHTSFAAPGAAGDALHVYAGNATCTNATTVAAGPARSSAAVFGAETNGGWTWQCVGS